VRFRRERAVGLAGPDLACWCPLDDQPCRAQVLLDVAAGHG
jgi:hypothetical protein